MSRTGTRTRIRYRGNGAPPRAMRFGPKTVDQQCGFPTNRDRLVQDDYGLWVDPRFDSFDINEQDEVETRYP